MIPAILFRRTARPWLLFLVSSVIPAGWASAAEETMILRNAHGDTLYVHIDYSREPVPEAPKGWASWKAMEKDSFYVTDSGTSSESTHLRYTHPFYAELDGYKGWATDYIYFDHDKGQEPHYTGEIGFAFLKGDTVESWSSYNGHHLNDDSRVWSYEKGVDSATEMDFSVDQIVDGASLTPRAGNIVFLDRRAGWFGGNLPVPIARRAGSEAARPRQGWAAWGNGLVLTVPERATRLFLLDANGRRVWKAEALTPGSRLESPAGLAPGAFRYVWLP